MEKVNFPNYEHIFCSCGGIIGDESGKADVDMIRCNRCGKVYSIWKLDYDTIYRNEKTNWIYPVKRRKSSNEDYQGRRGS